MHIAANDALFNKLALILFKDTHKSSMQTKCNNLAHILPVEG